MVKIQDHKFIPVTKEASGTSQKKKTRLKESHETAFVHPFLGGEKMYQGRAIRAIETLRFNPNQIKDRLRAQISRHLWEGFHIPELVEGLVEYLLDVVERDPKKAQLLGVGK